MEGWLSKAGCLPAVLDDRRVESRAVYKTSIRGGTSRLIRDYSDDSVDAARPVRYPDRAFVNECAAGFASDSEVLALAEPLAPKRSLVRTSEKQPGRIQR